MGWKSDLLAETISSWTELIERSLDEALGPDLSYPDQLLQAMRYSVMAGGKRLRPLLVLMSADACQGAIDAALPAACAVELVHTYSLIHDDLPAMDNDDLRRGKPTCHRQFDEATAILAGDALQARAFELLTEIRPSALALQCVQILAQAVGGAGMCGGQMDDLVADHQPRDMAWLRSLHGRKTGALLSASLLLGGVVANADETKVRALEEYGTNIGLAFQIVDDVLDVAGEPEVIGKAVRKDASAGKVTYPAFLGIEESQRQARQLADAARDCLGPFGPAGCRLAALADFIVERDR